MPAPQIFTFPSLAPNTLRDLTLPDYGVVTYTFEDGTETRRYTHNSGNHTRLLLEYEGRNSAEVANFLNFYKQVKGLYHPFTLPPEINQHPDAYKNAIIGLGDTTLWRINKRTVIKTVFTDIYSWDVELLSIIE